MSKPEISSAALYTQQAEILAALHGLAAEVKALRADMAGRNRPPALRKEQSDALAAILPVLAGIYGDARFACWEVLDAAKQNDVDGANIRIVLAGRTAQQLGKLLQAGLGRDFNGVQIIRDGADGDGKLWRCISNPLSLMNK